jgi:hypothetical protein
MFGCGEMNSAGGGGGILDACGGGLVAQPANNAKPATKGIISIKIGFFIDSLNLPATTVPQWPFQSNLQLQKMNNAHTAPAFPFHF